MQNIAVKRYNLGTMVSASLEIVTRPSKGTLYYREKEAAAGPKVTPEQVISALGDACYLIELVNYPRLFEESASTITEELLRDQAGLEQLEYREQILARLDRCNKAQSNPNEQLSPFRVNAYEAITATWGLLFGSNFRSGEQFKSFQDWLGSNADNLERRLNRLKEVATEKRKLGKVTEKKQIVLRKNRQLGMTEVLGILDEISFAIRNAPITPLEARSYLSYGLLMAAYLGEVTDRAELRKEKEEIAAIIMTCLGQKEDQ